jgi:glycosyltransferase involved in cell wall biosynthesis
VTPRLLILSAYPPSLEAPHGGSRVAAQLIRGLAGRNRVALVCLRGEDEPPVDPGVAERCESVTAVARPAIPPGDARRRRLTGLAKGRPSWVADWAVAECRARVAELTEAWQPGLVHVHYQVMGQYLRALRGPRVPRVLVVYEPATSRAAAAVREAPLGPRRALRYADYLAWRRFESGLLRSVEAVTVFTDRDRDDLARLAPRDSISVVPFGVEAPARALDPVGDEARLLFLGNFVHRPNVDAALRLGSAIFPRVRAAHPAAHLELVGPEPPPELAALAGDRVSVTGAVPDVTPYLDRASVFVAPIRRGGGMRVKVLEALAAGKAIVASPLAAEGLDVADQLLLAYSDDDFVAAISQLLAEPARRRELADRARRFALDRLGWERTLAAYERLHASLLSPAAPERDHEGVAGEAADAEAVSPPASVSPAPEDAEKPREA